MTKIKKIPDRIKQIQKSLNYTQQEFVNQTGVCPGILASWYYRGSTPNGETLSQLFENIQVINPYWLFTGKGIPQILSQKWKPEDEKRFREEYKEFIFLFENSTFSDLVQGFYKILGADDWAKQLELDFKKPLPEYCWGHNQFYWSDCTECQASKEANFSFRKNSYEIIKKTNYLN